MDMGMEKMTDAQRRKVEPSPRTGMDPRDEIGYLRSAVLKNAKWAREKRNTMDELLERMEIVCDRMVGVSSELMRLSKVLNDGRLASAVEEAARGFAHAYEGMKNGLLTTTQEMGMATDRMEKLMRAWEPMPRGPLSRLARLFRRNK